MHYLDLDEVIELHADLLRQTGGTDGIRDYGLLQSALAQPKMTFDGADLYQSLEEKAGALAFSLIMNHPFVDGNKRIGYAAMETMLVMNRHEIRASIDESEEMTLAVAAGESSREKLVDWLKQHIVPLK